MADFEEESFEFNGSPEELFKLLKRLGAKPLAFGNLNRHWSDDPKKYPRAVKIEDQSIILDLWKLEKQRAEYMELKEKIELLDAQLAATRLEIFAGLRAKYPEIDHRRRFQAREGGAGWREFEGTYYYVGWDKDDPRED